MNRHRHLHTLVFASFAFALLASAETSHAGLGDALKKKLGDKAAKKAEAAVDKAADKTEKAATPGEAVEAEKGESGAAATGTGGAGGKVSAVSTKFDYVPGDSVMFMDDFKQDELGEFPARWRLAQGTFEVAEMEGERWLRCTSADGRVSMKLPAMDALPEFWTLEFDFYATEPMASALTVRALGNSERMVWEATYPQGDAMAFRTGAINSSTPREGAGTVAGRHHVMFMARGTAIKAYLDRQRMASVPEIAVADGAPSAIEIRLWASTKPMIANVRFAEGCRPAKDMLDQGKLVTYGIRFQTGSDVVLPESAPVLRQVAAYMEAHAEVKLKITGHTDNVGAAASNLDLSKRRAASVAKVLSEQFTIAADRFATDGKGDTQAVASNAKPEGRAMNRRVEFAKL
jgi:outer membrane protein OmpA-like peptidoglycan-associated protein